MMAGLGSGERPYARTFLRPVSNSYRPSMPRGGSLPVLKSPPSTFVSRATVSRAMLSSAMLSSDMLSSDMVSMAI